VTIILLDSPKVAPVSSYFADIKYVNSGVCIQSPEYSRVLIWRKEECTKVLIHELIHAYRLDTFVPLHELEKTFQSLFVISKQSVCLPREAITELYANLVMVTFLSFLTGKDVFDEHLSWSLDRMSFVLKNIRKNSHGEFIQKTDVLSYYVLKALFMCAIKDDPTSFLLNPDPNICSLVRKRKLWNELREVSFESTNRSLCMVPPTSIKCFFESI
jgi:hypothetical protein